MSLVLLIAAHSNRKLELEDDPESEDLTHSSCQGGRWPIAKRRTKTRGCQLNLAVALKKKQLREESCTWFFSLSNTNVIFQSNLEPLFCSWYPKSPKIKFALGPPKSSWLLVPRSSLLVIWYHVLQLGVMFTSHPCL